MFAPNCFRSAIEWTYLIQYKKEILNFNLDGLKSENTFKLSPYFVLLLKCLFVKHDKGNPNVSTYINKVGFCIH